MWMGVFSSDGHGTPQRMWGCWGRHWRRRVLPQIGPETDEQDPSVVAQAPRSARHRSRAPAAPDMRVPKLVCSARISPPGDIHPELFSFGQNSPPLTVKLVCAEPGLHSLSASLRPGDSVPQQVRPKSLDRRVAGAVMLASTTPQHVQARLQLVPAGKHGQRVVPGRVGEAVRSIVGRRRNLPEVRCLPRRVFGLCSYVSLPERPHSVIPQRLPRAGLRGGFQCRKGAQTFATPAWRRGTRSWIDGQWSPPRRRWGGRVAWTGRCDDRPCRHFRLRADRVAENATVPRAACSRYEAFKNGRLNIVAACHAAGLAFTIRGGGAWRRFGVESPSSVRGCRQGGCSAEGRRR